jgi:hypothetical protein
VVWDPTLRAAGHGKVAARQGGGDGGRLDLPRALLRGHRQQVAGRVRADGPRGLRGASAVG